MAIIFDKHNIHACTNETYSAKSDPYFGRHNNKQHKAGLNLVDLLEHVFYLCMHECNYPAGIVFVCTYDQTQRTANNACRVGIAHNFLADSCYTCFLTFIVILASFVKFQLVYFNMTSFHYLR